MPTKPVAKKPILGKPQAVKPAQKNVVQKKPAPDKVENLAKDESELTELVPPILRRVAQEISGQDQITVF